MLKHSSTQIALSVLVSASGVHAQSGWLQLHPPAAPAGRQSHAMAYDSARGRVVLFGGTNAAGTLADTWEWDGSTWAQRTPANSPPPRFNHAMTYDARRGRTVLFGGHISGNLGDTWEWDGTDWSQRFPATNPRARNSHAMAYDNARGRVLLFGGYAGASTYPVETFEWDGTNWIQSSTATHPAGRYDHGMAYDSARGHIVLFGGAGNFRDTWIWDGANWSQISPATSPPASIYSIAYDSSRGRTVLFGSGGTLGDTWEWDGTNWAQRSTANSPSARVQHAIVYDSVRRRTLLFGGYYNGVNLGDTWDDVHDVVPATYAPFGSSCAGSAGMPTLQPLGTSLPWLGERFTLLFNNIPPGRPVFVFVGGSNATWYGQFPLPVDLTGTGMTGCWLLVSGDVVGLAQSVVNFVPWNLDICQCPELLGARFYNQGFVYDPTANPMGLTSTNGGEGVVGIR